MDRVRIFELRKEKIEDPKGSMKTTKTELKVVITKLLGFN